MHGRVRWRLPARACRAAAAEVRPSPTLLAAPATTPAVTLTAAATKAAAKAATKAAVVAAKAAVAATKVAFVATFVAAAAVAAAFEVVLGVLIDLRERRRRTHVVVAAAAAAGGAPPVARPEGLWGAYLLGVGADLRLIRVGLRRRRRRRLTVKVRLMKRMGIGPGPGFGAGAALRLRGGATLLGAELLQRSARVVARPHVSALNTLVQPLPALLADGDGQILGSALPSMRAVARLAPSDGLVTVRLLPKGAVRGAVELAPLRDRSKEQAVF